MDLLLALTYYRPHVSGLTIYVERLAKALARRGHRVTVLTSRYHRSLAPEEMVDGVRVVRVPVAFRFSKWVFMPGFTATAIREIRNHQIVNIHLPQAEGGLLASLAKAYGKPSVLTYHCDLKMPEVWYGPLVDKVVYWDNILAATLADNIVAYTKDFATHSPLLSRYMDKVTVILPPVIIPEPTEEGKAKILTKAGVDGKRKICFAARFAAEKGADYLIKAIEHVIPHVPNAHLLFAGEYKNVLGETIYQDLQPLIRKYKDYITFLGVLSPEKMSDFFSICDLLVVASINSTESFGLVQVEAMLNGTPVVATNLPGVRQPVQMTGMGEIVPIKDEKALAEAIVKVLQNRDAYIRPKEEIRGIFSLNKTVQAYENLFARHLEETK